MAAFNYSHCSFVCLIEQTKELDSHRYEERATERENACDFEPVNRWLLLSTDRPTGRLAGWPLLSSSYSGSVVRGGSWVGTLEREREEERETGAILALFWLRRLYWPSADRPFSGKSIFRFRRQSFSNVPMCGPYIIHIGMPLYDCFWVQIRGGSLFRVRWPMCLTCNGNHQKANHKIKRFHLRHTHTYLPSIHLCAPLDGLMVARGKGAYGASNNLSIYLFAHRPTTGGMARAPFAPFASHLTHNNHSAAILQPPLRLRLRRRPLP